MLILAGERGADSWATFTGWLVLWITTASTAGSPAATASPARRVPSTPPTRSSCSAGFHAGHRGDVVWLPVGDHRNPRGPAICAVPGARRPAYGVRIPLRPFFSVTSVLLYYMAFVFMGKGVRELQEGNAMPITLIPGLPARRSVRLVSDLADGARAAVVCSRCSCSRSRRRSGRSARSLCRPWSLAHQSNWISRASWHPSAMITSVCALVSLRSRTP